MHKTAVLSKPVSALKLQLKQIYYHLHLLALPLLVKPPRVLYRGSFITVTRRETMRMLETWCNRIHGDVLDVGVGGWTYPRQLLEGRCTYTTTDCFEHPNIDRVSDIHKLDAIFPAESFDFVICTSVLEHVLRPWVAVRQLYTVLRPGGTLLLTVPFNFHLHGRAYQDYWRMSGEALRYLLIDEAGFRSVEITHVGHPKFPFSYNVVAQK